MASPARHKKGGRGTGHRAARIVLWVQVAAAAAGTWCLWGCQPTSGQPRSSADAADFPWLFFLTQSLVQSYVPYIVYTDPHAASNHFHCRARMASPGDEDCVLSMDEDCRERPVTGSACIRCTFRSRGSNWGGWYFMNGVLQGADTAPKANWGTYSDAGLDLRGATALTFWARGAAGGERVEFFAFGVGRDADTGIAVERWPDSSPRVSTGYITLTADWKQYAIGLESRDLSYVLGGFGWTTNARENGNRDITFFLDDIFYTKSTSDQPHFAVSYETTGQSQFDTMMRNVAFSYDNALALIAFASVGAWPEAKSIADSFVYAQQHDRDYSDGRLRNAYQGGDIALPPGWMPKGKRGTTRLPGWYDTEKEQWFEDAEQVGSYTGNMAWVILALLTYYEAKGGDSYLAAAERLGEWIEQNCRDVSGAGGYTAGYRGWAEHPEKLLWKATEHNIDVYAAFSRLHCVTGDAIWNRRSQHARRFVEALWDDTEGKFWTGTREDGVTVNRDVVPLDIQAWAIMALGVHGGRYERAVRYAEAHLARGDGFGFSDKSDGVWYEGVAHMALAYQIVGKEAKRQRCLQVLRDATLPSGAIPAASVDGLGTGLGWEYCCRSHLGTTAWCVAAKIGANPLWAGP